MKIAHDSVVSGGKDITSYLRRNTLEIHSGPVGRQPAVPAPLEAGPPEARQKVGRDLSPVMRYGGVHGLNGLFPS